MENIIETNHPLIQHKISVLRNKNTLCISSMHIVLQGDAFITTHENSPGK